MTLHTTKASKCFLYLSTVAYVLFTRLFCISLSQLMLLALVSQTFLDTRAKFQPTENNCQQSSRCTNGFKSNRFESFGSFTFPGGIHSRTDIAMKLSLHNVEAETVCLCPQSFIEFVELSTQQLWDDDC